jgi:RNA polymerase sigma-70 factor (sigma-E family)
MEAAVFAEWITTEAAAAGWARDDVEVVIERLFTEQGAGLVRLARFFVDDVDAAEDLVQEGFIKLARSLHRIEDPSRVPAYLRSIVLNLARDHNRRGLVSLRHRSRLWDPGSGGPDEEWEIADEHRQVIEALRTLPPGQRNCLVLRYYLELSNRDIADTLGVSINTVKTQLQRGMRRLENVLGGSE